MLLLYGPFVELDLSFLAIPQRSAKALGERCHRLLDLRISSIIMGRNEQRWVKIVNTGREVVGLGRPGRRLRGPRTISGAPYIPVVQGIDKQLDFARCARKVMASNAKVVLAIRDRVLARYPSNR